MSRYKALVAVVVAGERVEAGQTFEADEEQVRDALAAGLVKAAPANGRRREKP
jgi:hypothetical protein